METVIQEQLSAARAEQKNSLRHASTGDLAERDAAQTEARENLIESRERVDAAERRAIIAVRDLNEENANIREAVRLALEIVEELGESTCNCSICRKTRDSPRMLKIDELTKA